MKWMRQKDILGLQIAVNDLVLFEQHQRAEKLSGHAPDNVQRESTERIRLDPFVEIGVEKLGRDAKMVAKVEALHKANYIVLPLGILTALA